MDSKTPTFIQPKGITSSEKEGAASLFSVRGRFASGGMATAALWSVGAGYAVISPNPPVPQYTDVVWEQHANPIHSLHPVLEGLKQQGALLAFKIDEVRPGRLEVLGQLAEDKGLDDYVAVRLAIKAALQGTTVDVEVSLDTDAITA